MSQRQIKSRHAKYEAEIARRSLTFSSYTLCFGFLIVDYLFLPSDSHDMLHWKHKKYTLLFWYIGIFMLICYIHVSKECQSHVNWAFNNAVTQQKSNKCQYVIHGILAFISKSNSCFKVEFKGLQTCDFTCMTVR